MVSKYGHLMVPGVFPGKITHANDFTDETVAQYDALVIKCLLNLLNVF